MADSDTDVFAIRCFLNEDRKKTNELDKHEAIAFRAACPGFDARRGPQSRDGVLNDGGSV